MWKLWIISNFFSSKCQLFLCTVKQLNLIIFNVTMNKNLSQFLRELPPAPKMPCALNLCWYKRQGMQMDQNQLYLEIFALLGLFLPLIHR